MAKDLSTSEDLKETGISFVADVMAVFGIPTNMAMKLAGDWLARRDRMAKELLLEQLRKGDATELDIANEDDLFAILYKYLAAARQGAARHNLRLLAQAIKGLVERDRLYLQEFDKYAWPLAQLTLDQCIVLGTFYRNLRGEERRTREGPILDETKYHQSNHQNAWRNTYTELVEKQFPSEAHIQAIAAQIGATGFFVTATAWKDTAYMASPLLREAMNLINIDDALRE